MDRQERPRPVLTGFFAAASAVALDAVKSAALAAKPERKESKEVNLLDETDYILFDWDGVLFNSTRREHAAVLMLLQERGDKARVANLTVAEVECTYDLPIWDYLRTYGVKVDGVDEADTQRIRDELTDYFRNVVKPKVPVESGDDELYPEAIETIKALRDNGKRLAIISAGSAEKIHEVLTKHGLDDCFESVTGGQQNKAQAIKSAADKAGEDGIAAHRITYFGDLPSDIRHTHASGAGVRAVAVARNGASEERLEGHDPDYMVNGLSLNSLTRAKKYTKTS